MEFVGILGDRGSGKTAWMTRYAIQAANSGKRVIANYRLKGIKAELMSFEELRKIVSSKHTIHELANAHIFLDELGTGADSYEFFLKDTKAITDWVNQVRKLENHVYYTAQRERQIARRIRIQTDTFIALKDLDRGKLTYPDGKLAENHMDVCDGVFVVYMLNEDMEPVGKRYFNGKNYYQYYNTKEIVWG